MCDIATAALIMAGGGQIYSGMTQKAIGEANAAAATQQAAVARQVGRHNQKRMRDRMSRLIGRQTGQIASRGVQLDSQAAGNLAEDAGYERAVESQVAQFQTAQQVAQFQNEATIQEFRGTTGMMQGVFNAGGTVLNGALDLWPELGGQWQS
jgi:protein-disulfide isomerase